MQKYKKGKILGDGSFGSVVKAVNEKTKQVVAIKEMKQKYTNWEQCINLNQIKVLIKLHHPNVVRLYQLIKDNNQLYFVFQYMERNVFQLMMEKKKIDHYQIRNIIYQTLQGLAYMHRHGFFHRDLKPENLLEMHGTVKIADFGLSRQIRAKPPFTQYVSTRWYRAPEVLLRSRSYNSPMDIFAIGAIMAELYKCTPLFPGMTERDQITKILQIMGTPTKEQWPDGYKLASSINLMLPQFEKVKLSKVIPQAPKEALQLIEWMLQVNPQKRPTALQCLQHQYFKIIACEQKSETFQYEQLMNKQEIKQQQQQQDWLYNVKYKVGYKCQPLK